MDKSREEFEVWFKEYCEENGIQCYLKVMDIGCYLSSFTEACFESWKASRENMKAIELPDQADYFSSEYDNDGNDILGFDIESYSSDFIDAITSAGYKVE